MVAYLFESLWLSGPPGHCLPQVGALELESPRHMDFAASPQVMLLPARGRLRASVLMAGLE